MIVSCPNCFLEQPKDQYCAGCGKQLDKLLEEKSLKISKSIKRTNYLIAFITICFLGGSLYFYQHHKTSNINTFTASTEEGAKVELPKVKIKGAFETPSPTPEKKLAATVPTPIKKKVDKKPPPVEALSGPKKIKTFYFLSLNSCDEVFDTGELNNDELKDLLSCATVHFKTSRKAFDDIIEDGPSFSTQFSLKQDEYLIELGFILTTDLYVEEFKQTLPFEIEGSAPATLWENTGHDIESLEEPDKDMLSNYATSALFNFSSPGEPSPELYFLAQYK